MPKVAGMDSLAARLGHLLRVASKTGAIRLRRSRKPSDGWSRSASSDASSPRLQPDGDSSHTDSLHASQHRDRVPSNSQEGGTMETALPYLKQVDLSHAPRPRTRSRQVPGRMSAMST